MPEDPNIPDAHSTRHKREHLRQFISENTQALLHSLRLYALRAGLARQDQGESIAHDLLSEVVVEALEHAERFDDTRHAMSWLLGIGANLIRRHLAETNRRERREPLVSDLYNDDTLSEVEIFERVVEFASASASELESKEQIDALLDGLTAEEQQIVKLAILYDMDGARIAEHMGLRPGTARMRLHRALKRLRMIHGNMTNDDVWNK